MGYKRGRRNPVVVVTHRPNPEPIDNGTEPIADGYAHMVGFNLALFSPHVSLIREQLKLDDSLTSVRSRQMMLHVIIYDKSPQPGNAMVQARQALEDVITRLDRCGWKASKRVAPTRG